MNRPRRRLLLLALTLGAWLGAHRPAAASVKQLTAALEQSLCLRQWSRAVELTGALMAMPDVSATERQNLLAFRTSLEQIRAQQLPVVLPESCDRTLALTLDVPSAQQAVSQPLDWSRGLALLTYTRPIVQLDVAYDPADDLIPAGLLAESPDILTATAAPIDTADGFSVVAGRGQQVYSFLGRLGDRVSLDVDILQGSSDTGDSQLFLFDYQGRLVAQNDDDGRGQQSAIVSLPLPYTHAYFAVVAGQATRPILDGAGVLQGWQTAPDSFSYTLTLTGVTPSQALVQSR